jgi:CRISPR-associated endonuclease Csn1
MENQNSEKTILGIDLGPNSIGWVLYTSNNPTSRIHAGVRAFDAGLDNLETDGKGKSRNLARREARSSRRRLYRQTRRIVKLAGILKERGFFPSLQLNDSLERHRVLNEFDASHDSPYLLRTKALDNRLEPIEFGRALFHMAQRRGFLSNRKSGAKDDKEEGIVKKAIGVLEIAIKEANSRTLGEYFAQCVTRGERVREKYTARKMYEEEFETIWKKQSEYRETLKDSDFKKQVHRAIFFQRPLKSVAKFVGKCDLEKGQRRAPWSFLLAQEYRYLDCVNRLRVIDKSTGEISSLSDLQRAAVIEVLARKESVTFASLKKLPGFPKKADFNLESGEETKIPGNKLVGRLVPAIGPETVCRQTIRTR